MIKLLTHTQKSFKKMNQPMEINKFLRKFRENNFTNFFYLKLKRQTKPNKNPPISIVLLYHE